MSTIFNIDHKVFAVTTVAAVSSVTAYTLYRLHTLKQKLAAGEGLYETAKYLNDYLIFHYGSSDEILPWSFGPKSDVDFPKRCAELFVKHTAGKVLFAPTTRFITVSVGVELTRSVERWRLFLSLRVVAISAKSGTVMLCQISSKSLQPWAVAEISRFFDFSRWRPPL